MNSVKRHINDTKNMRLGYDLPASVNDKMISPFLDYFIFTKLLAKISEFTVFISNKVSIPRGVGTLIVSSYIGFGPASTVQEFQAPQKNI